MKKKTMIMIALFAGLAATGVIYATIYQVPAPPYTFVMSIGGEGTGEGQFKYIEDFAIDARVICSPPMP